MRLVKLLFIVIAVLVVTGVTYSNHSLDDSQVVSDLSREIAALEKENTVVRAKVAEAGSLTQIHERVAELGFVTTPEIVSVPAPGAIASR